VAQTERSLASMLPSAPLEAPVTPLAGAPSAGPAIAAGAKAAGALLPGAIAFGPNGKASFQPDAAAGAFAEPLVTPVRLYGNVVEAVRGETVGEEVIGSGDAAQPRQRFTLKKKPLTWVEDASQGLGRAPQLTIRVDGLAWTYVESFYGRGPDERIYRVEMDVEGRATIMLGDGVTGARATSGVNNIVASYRWGAGAAKPPAGSFKQIARPAKGLARVAGPLAAYGGADAEKAGELRSAAPAGMLSLGRAVSVADFEAMVRAYSGITNAAVAYSWDAVRHEATVLAWIISDAGDLSAPLAAFLSARAVPGLSIRVVNAVKIVVPVFDITIEAAEGHAPDKVREAVRVALFDPDEGRLSSRRIAISAPLFRSHLLAWIHAVPGVKAVKSIMLQNGEMPKAMTIADGHWFDFLSCGEVL
jgi:predicted phage baseplate assembly protein